MAAIALPRLISVGAKALDELPLALERLGLRRPAIITDRFLAGSGALDRLLGVFATAKVAIQVFTEAIPDPTTVSVDAAVAFLKSGSFDCVVALGGGSPIDTAKAAAVLAVHGGTMRALKTPHLQDVPGLPIIAIPTTAGTGSEATRFTIITDAETSEKMLCAGLAYLPSIAIVDYELTLAKPRRLTADTGIDALTHAIEAYVSKKANPFSDGMALAAMTSIWPNLRTACNDPGNRPAREAMMLGALQAGIAFSNASVALVHGMSRPIGAHFHVAHGLSNAMLLPVVTAWSVPAAQARYATCARAMGVAQAGDGDDIAVSRLIDALRAVNAELEVPSPKRFGPRRGEMDEAPAADGRAGAGIGVSRQQPARSRRRHHSGSLPSGLGVTAGPDALLPPADRVRANGTVIFVGFKLTRGNAMNIATTTVKPAVGERYFAVDPKAAPDPISGQAPKLLRYGAGGTWKTSKGKTMPCYDPSTGAVIALAPQCTAEEVEEAINAAAAAFPKWRDTPVNARVQVLFRMKALVDQHLEELTHLCAQENGKKWDEAQGDILKVVEVLEFACCAPQMMKGESLMNASVGYDTVQYREPLGVFAGIAPWNFPGMIPQGWMAPICIATGNCMVLKAASFAPQTAMRITELWKEAGLPDGVINIVTTSRVEAEILLKHPAIRGVTFVGSTGVGKHVYATAAGNGKRVQALTEAKNHALVLKDAVLERAAQSIINSFCGCAGERCMALPVIVVENEVADKLLAMVVDLAKKLKLGAAYDKTTGLGPVVNKGHQDFVLNWIETGLKEGAKLVLDGRKPKLEAGCEKGFFVGPTILDHVTEDMTCGREEIFGPVLCVKRVASFEEGLRLMNSSRFANGSVIFTESGYYAREFARNSDGGMVGINVGIPVPLAVFGFTGHKQSFFGDLHCMGKDGFAFYTETKNVTATWFTGQPIPSKVGTWEGTITR